MNIMRDWQYTADYNYVTAIDNGNCRVPITDHVYGQSDEQVLAHGYLMAAAPDMLSALEQLERWCIGKKDGMIGGHRAKVYRAIEPALRKARQCID